MRRTHELFTGTGVAIISAALVIGIFMLVWWGIGAVKSAIELRLERALVERLLTLVAPRQPSNNQSLIITPPASTNILETPALKQFIQSSDILGLVSASFSDLFSGVGWLDEEKTTMYHDKNATAFLFEPRFSLAKGTPPAFVEPSDAQWHGTVEKRGEMYEVRVNGELLASSPYEGTLGFGGSGDNSLVVYGAYEGAAFQFLGGARRDISQLFGIRMMGGGFAPVVLRAPVNNQSSIINFWYVFPRTGEPIRFLKLFENESGEIIGATDLTNKVSERVGSGRTLTSIRAGVDGSVWMEFGASGVREWYRFEDKGFVGPPAGGEKTVVSGDLNEGRDAAVRRARISRVDLSIPFSVNNQSSIINFFLANQPGTWFPAQVGEWVTFPAPDGKNLFWKAEFSIINDQSSFSSPFFDFIQVEYFLKF